MGEKPEDMQLKLWIAMFRAIARAVEGTFNANTFAPASECIDPEESRLPEVVALRRRLHDDATDLGSLSEEDVRLIKELVKEAMLRGHQERERREARAAAVEVVGEAGLRHALLNYLLIDGFDRRSFMWDRSFEEFEITARELEAIRLSRPLKDYEGGVRRQFKDVMAELGWAKPDNTRRKSIRSIELAKHFAELTQSGGRVSLRSSATGESGEYDAPMEGLEALEELRKLHEIASKEACLRNLERVRQTYEEFLREFEHLEDKSIHEARISKFPDLSRLPHSRGGELSERMSTG